MISGYCNYSERLLSYGVMDPKEMADRSWASRRAKYSPEEIRAQAARAGKKGGKAGRGKRKPRKNQARVKP